MTFNDRNTRSTITPACPRLFTASLIIRPWVMSMLRRICAAIIAASAITENLPLMTRNAKNFSRVSGLQRIDSFVD